MVALKYTRRMTNLQIKPNPTIEVTWTTSVYDYSKSKELDVIEKISKKFGVDKKHINVVTNLVSGTGSEEIVSLRDDVIGDIIASGTITARYRTHKAPVFICE